MTSIPLSRPELGQEEIDEVVAAMRSGWLSAGPRVARFEEAVAEYLGASHAVALSSGTAALYLAVRAHGIGPGDEVVTSAMTWPATVNAIELAGARPVFADIDRATLQIDPDCVETALSERTRALLPVHFAGQACDQDALEKIADREGLVLIEDCAHAIGTEYRGRRVGSGRSTSCFSFHPSKNMTTGEGGLLATPDAELAERVRILRFHGVSKDAWARYGDGSVSPLYETVVPSLKYALSDLQAAIGLHQLARLDGFIDRRARLAEAYLEQLADVRVVRPLGLDAATTRHAWHLFIVTLELERVGCDRAEFMRRLGARGIGTGLHFTAVHLHRHYRERYGFEAGHLPITEWASDRVFSLPLFPAMKEADVARVCEAIRELAQEVER